MDRIFELFFKYRPLLFREGDLAFGASWSGIFLVLAGGIAAGFAVWSYTRARGESTERERIVLTGIRVAIVALLVFCLMRPVLVLSSVVPQRNFLAVLVDDSRSMGIADRDADGPRHAFVTEAFSSGEGGGELAQTLAENFNLRYFRFGKGADRLEALEQLSYGQTRSDVGLALQRVREELAGVPLAGIVVVSDGADNSGKPLSESLVPLQASGIPVFSIGLGEERIPRDLELRRVETPTHVLKGATVVADVVLTHTGYRGDEVEVSVEEEGRILSTEQVEMGPNGEPVVARIRFKAEEGGTRRFTFRVATQEGEVIAENNQRDLLVEVGDRKEKILYFEGEPRYEVKFLRRAVEDDENLQLLLLQRTANEKFLPLPFEFAEELAGGFPTSREELFRYRGIILGSAEASFFTHDQLQMLQDFVSVRGGGLLVLGGRKSLAEGGYDGSPVDPVLPVVLEDVGPAGGSGVYTELKVHPTRAGLAHPVTHIASEEELRERWEALPPLSTQNPVRELKPGATALLTGEADGGDDRIVLAYQRYGRGKAAVFAVQDTWLWQMHYDVPLEDRSHEDLWTQLLRWLVDGVPNPVTAHIAEAEVEPGGSATLLAEVLDSTYLAVNNSQVTARVIDPLGNVSETRLEWTLEEDGEYRAVLPTPEPGLHEIQLTALRDQKLLGSDTLFFQVAPSNREFFEAGRNTSLLRRIADETGGRFYTPSTVASLPEDISVTASGITTREERDLWDMPALFLLLIGLLGAEWLFRKSRRMV